MFLLWIKIIFIIFAFYISTADRLYRFWNFDKNFFYACVSSLYNRSPLKERKCVTKRSRLVGVHRLFYYNLSSIYIFGHRLFNSHDWCSQITLLLIALLCDRATATEQTSRAPAFHFWFHVVASRRSFKIMIS